MADNTNDVLMKVLDKGTTFPAENRTNFTTAADALAAGFTAGCFFELQSFGYSVGSAMALSKKAETSPASDAGAPATSAGKVKSDFVDIQPVSFTRTFDIASIAMFKALVASQTLDCVTVVKRKAAGAKSAGKIFLRIDFNKVLLTDLKWAEEGETVLETGSFIYREMAIQYRPQREDGSLGAVIPASWKMPS